MPIIRGRHAFDSHFTQIPNAWIRDKRLSYKARGLLAELLSHEPGFSVSRERLARNGQDGDRAVRTAIAELEAAGYLRRSQERSSGTQTFGPAIWITCDPEPSVHYAPAGYAPAGYATPKKTILEKTKDQKEDLVQDRLEPESKKAFNDFWSVYPRRQGRGAALKAFEVACRKESIESIMAGARSFAADPNLPPKQYIPMPATWLNQERWSDGPLPERERTAEEKLERDREIAARKRDAEKRHTEQLMRESEEAKRNAAPPPQCEHGISIIKCRTCLLGKN